jgi:hypothetical protein
VDFHENEAETRIIAVVVSGIHSNALTAFPTPSQNRDGEVKANKLSPHEVEWRVIDEVARATVKPETSLPFPDLPAVASAEVFPTDLVSPPSGLSARQILFQRRSAVAMDGTSSISTSTFYRMLARTLPWSFDEKGPRPPWDATGWEPRVHLCLFVHRVEGIVPGLYTLVRSPATFAPLREAMKQDFEWHSRLSEKLPLFLGGWRRFGVDNSFGQDTLRMEPFSLGMVAEFRELIRELGPWLYRRLFWRQDDWAGSLFGSRSGRDPIDRHRVLLRRSVHDFGFKDNQFKVCIILQ